MGREANVYRSSAKKREYSILIWVIPSFAGACIIPTTSPGNPHESDSHHEGGADRARPTNRIATYIVVPPSPPPGMPVGALIHTIQNNNFMHHSSEFTVSPDDKVYDIPRGYHMAVCCIFYGEGYKASYIGRE